MTRGVLSTQELQDQVEQVCEELGTVALSFGDVLPSIGRETSLVAMAKEIVVLGVLAFPALLPFRASKSQQSCDFLLIAAPLDKRSIDRISGLSASLEAHGFSCVSLHSLAPSGVAMLKFDVVTCALRLSLSPLRMFSIYRRVKKIVSETRIAVQIVRWISVQTSRGFVARDLIDSLSPSILLTDYDRGLPGAPFVIAANTSGVRSVSLMHGDPTRMTYFPPLATTFCFWSDPQRAKYSEWCGSLMPGRVVGAHWKPALSVDDRSLCVPNRANALLVHSGVEGFESYLLRHEETIRDFESRGFVVRVRPHPLGKVRTSNTRISENSLEIDLRWAGVVVTEGSSVILDALSHQDLRVAVPLHADLSEFASLAQCIKTPTEDLPGEWVYFDPTVSRSWPFAYRGDKALEATVEYLANLRLEVSNG